MRLATPEEIRERLLAASVSAAQMAEACRAVGHAGVKLASTARGELEKARYFAIDRKGCVPCHMATATRNATITDLYGVACYSKTDVVKR
jgi:hypothetical protein